MAGEDIERRLAAIISADVAGYSRLMGKDETGTLSALKALRKDVFAPQVATHKGRVVKLMGDGALVEFPSVVDAVDCAIAVQRTLAERAIDEAIKLRIGINLGDIIIEDSDIYGDGVNVAARIQEVAKPGGIALSGSAFDQVSGKVVAVFKDAGEHELKNIDKPVRVYRWTDAAADAMDAAAAPAPLDMAIAMSMIVRPSIAVLPFVEMGSHAEQLRFGDGLVADINRELARSGIIEVIGQQISRRYSLDSDSAETIGRSLGVGYILSGSIRFSGERTRVSTELLEASTGRSSWSERYDRALIDPLETQEELAQSIAGIVEPSMVRLERERITRTTPEQMKPHELMHYAWKLSDQGTWEGVRRGEQYCEQAIKLDPGYSDAHSQLAWILWIDVLSGWASNSEATMKRALSCSEKALSLNPKDYDALGARGVTLVALGRYEAAEKVIDEISKRFPSHAYGLSYQAVLLDSMGQHAEGMVFAEEAMATNPEHDQWFWMFLGQCLFHLERFPEAVEALEQFKVLSGFRFARLLLAASYAASRRGEEAKAEIASLGSDWENLIPGVALCYRETVDRERLIKWVKVAAESDHATID